jgi:hypothetical protein
LVLMAILANDVPQPAAGLESDAPSRIATPRSRRAFDPQLINTNSVGGAVVAADSLGRSFSVR